MPLQLYTNDAPPVASPDNDTAPGFDGPGAAQWLAVLVNQFKKGWKTTEFWISAAAVIVNALVLSGVISTTTQWGGIAASVASAIIAGAYSMGRSNLKVERAAAVREQLSDMVFLQKP